MEIWKPLRDFPSYNVSSEGRVMNVKTQRILKTRVDDRGYEKVSLRKHNRPYTIRVHKLIAETFLGEHPGMDIRHKDLNRSNNKVSNLYFTTHSETISDAFDRGSKRPSRCREVSVVETGKSYSSIRECSRETSCDPSNICKQLNGQISNTKGLHFNA